MDKVKRTKKQLTDISSSEYKYGFKTNIEEERLPNGLNEDIIKFKIIHQFSIWPNFFYK